MPLATTISHFHHTPAFSTLSLAYRNPLSREATTHCPATSPRMSSSQHKRSTRVVVAADLTKWAACAAVGAALLYRRDAVVVLYCAGAGLNSAAAKLLKQLIRQPRPTDSKADPGMPSSHATSLSFLSLALFACVLMDPPVVTAVRAIYYGGAALVVALALLATSWRVKAGYHTVEQVVAGWLLGAVDTVLWVKLLLPSMTSWVDAVLGDDRIALPLIGVILVVSFITIFPGHVASVGGLTKLSYVVFRCSHFSRVSGFFDGTPCQYGAEFFFFIL